MSASRNPHQTRRGRLLLAAVVATSMSAVAVASAAEPTGAATVAIPARSAELGDGRSSGSTAVGPGAVGATTSGQSTALSARPEATGAASPAVAFRPQIDTPTRVRQLITVTARRFSSTHGTLRAWSRTSGGDWRLRYGPIPAVVGYNGWVAAAKRRQGTGTTPAGVFNLPSAFGRYSNPGSGLKYRHVDKNDWWPYEPRDPATYNVYQRHKARGTHWRSDKAENLNSYTRQYGYAMVIGFNLAGGVHYSGTRRQWVATRRADTRLGGGIFLHVRGDGETAGCVAVARTQMRWLLRWVRPAAHAKIAMGPRRYLARF